MRLKQPLLACFGSNPNHKGGAGSAAAHAAVHHEVQPPKHLLLDDI